MYYRILTLRPNMYYRLTLIKRNNIFGLIGFGLMGTPPSCLTQITAMSA